MFKGDLIGNVGGDPEFRYTQNETLVGRFSLAHNYRKRDQEGDWQTRTEWVTVLLFGQLAETLNENCWITKGMRLYVTGQVEAGPYQAKDGTMRAGLQIIARDIQSMMPPDPNAQRGSSYGWGEQMTGQPSGQRAHSPAGTNDSEDDDDNPF